MLWEKRSLIYIIFKLNDKETRFKIDENCSNSRFCKRNIIICLFVSQNWFQNSKGRKGNKVKMNNKPFLRHQATKCDGCDHVKNRNLGRLICVYLWQWNLPSSCFAFSSTHLLPSRSRTLPLFRFLITRDFTVVGSTSSGSLIIFLNSLFSNPSSPLNVSSFELKLSG